MGLKKKTFLYSIVLAAIMIVFVIGYFVWMLPSLYVDYVMDSNLESAVQLQRTYMEHKNYDGVEVKNPTSMFTLEIPDTGSQIYLAGTNYRVTITIQDEALQSLFDEIRQTMSEAGSEEGAEEESEKEFGEEFEETDFSMAFERWQKAFVDIFAGRNLIAENYPIEVELEQQNGRQGYYGEYYKVHRMADNIIVYESGISDGNYGYTTYIAMGRAKDAYVVTLLPTMTPKMEEITPIVMGSLPMIVAVIVLVVLVSSGFFAGRIVNPIIRLAVCAENVGTAGVFEADGIEEFDSDRKDEIGMLGRNLHELYERLRQNYEELEEKNQLLEEENERQEVFLRASSHQLKTPIAAALLLVEGMMNEVGKYRDTKKYLPKVKEQLLSMRKIVEDILYLNYRAKNMEYEEVAVEEAVRELLQPYAVQAEDRELQMTVKGHKVITADREMLQKIADNMFSNAVQYTPDGERIVIEITDTALLVTNYGVTIDEKLLPHVLEPFVSSDTDRKGRGLGLYVAAYYSRLLGYRLSVHNVENGVCARLAFAIEKPGTHIYGIDR